MAMVGALIGAVGTLVQAAGAAQMASYQAQVAKNNQIIAGYNATYAKEKGAREESAYKMKVSQTVEATRAAQGASGFDIGSPTFGNILASEAAVGKLDTLTIRNNAARSAYNFEVEGMNLGAQAKLYEMQASNAMISGMFGAASSLIGAFGSVSPKWSSWQSGAAPSAPLTYSGPSVAYSGPAPGLSSPMVPAASVRTPWPGGSTSGPSYYI